MEADLRNLTRGLKQSIEKLEQRQQQLEQKLAVITDKLADSELYDASRKAELTKILAEQTQYGNELRDIEEQWFTAQEALESKTEAFWQANGG